MVEFYDTSITTSMDYAEHFALSPIRDDETKAQFRARVAKELFRCGRRRDAYQVLHNTNDPDYFLKSGRLQGSYCDGDVDKTAALVQGRYEWMIKTIAEDKVWMERAARQWELFVRLRRLLTLGLWR